MKQLAMELSRSRKDNLKPICRMYYNWMVECWRGYLFQVYGSADATATHCFVLQ